MDYGAALQLGSLIVSAAGFFALFRQLELTSRSAQAKVFMSYADKFTELKRGYPASVVNADRRDELMKRDREKFVNFTSAYLSLLHQEHALYEAGMIDERIWGIWCRSFESFALTPEFPLGWENYRSEQTKDPQFNAFVETTMGIRAPWYSANR